MSNLTKQDIKDWLGEEVTKEFFRYIRILTDDSDKNVHRALENLQYEQAAYFHAGLAQLKEIQDTPDRMIFDIEEEGDE
jgi:hypothetical protein